VFHATTFLELALFLYCWLIFAIYTLRQKCLVMWAFSSLPWFWLNLSFLKAKLSR